MEAVKEVEGTRKGSRARKVLLALCAAHAAALLMSFFQSPVAPSVPGFLMLAALNALAIAGLTRRTRAGWYLVLLFVFAAGARWTGGALDGAYSLFALLAIAAGVFCITDPELRREHGMTS